MSYKKKAIILAVVTGVLALLYGFTLFFDPERVSERNASFSWIPGGARDEADRIEVIRSGEADSSESFTLVRKSDGWFALIGTGLEVPVKQGRIDDIFRILSEKGAFPLRGSSPASHEALGLVPGEASRLLVWGGAGAVPLLDLLIGGNDSSGREVFLRKNGENNFRSGERLIATYLNGNDTDWYDLRLFHDDPSASVQRVRVSPVKGSEGDGDYTLAKSGGSWVFEGSSGIPDGTKVDPWIKGIFELQGDYFIPGTEAAELSAGKVTIELGDGSTRTIQVGDALPEDGGTEKRPAMVSGAPYLFALSQWSLQNRLFRARSSLE
jgi:hypothetical protein